MAYWIQHRRLAILGDVCNRWWRKCGRQAEHPSPRDNVVANNTSGQSIAALVREEYHGGLGQPNVRRRGIIKGNMITTVCHKDDTMRHSQQITSRFLIRLRALPRSSVRDEFIYTESNLSRELVS